MGAVPWRCLESKNLFLRTRNRPFLGLPLDQLGNLASGEVMQSLRCQNHKENKGEADEREEQLPFDEREAIRKRFGLVRFNAVRHAFFARLANSVRYDLLRAIADHLFAPCTDNFHAV